MTNRNGQPKPSSPTSDLESLEQRVKAAKQKYEKPENDDNSGSLLGMAWRLSTELLVSVLVGAALGYGLDTLIGTKPWFLLIGLGFGIAAGIRSVLRSAEKMDAMNSNVPIGKDLPEDTEDEDF